MGNVLCVPNRNKDVDSAESVPGRRRGVRHWITHRILGRRSNAVAPRPVHGEDGCISAGTDKSDVDTPSGVVGYSEGASSSTPSPSCSLDSITSVEIQEISTTDVVAPSYITIATSSAVTIAANTATQMATTSAPHTIVQLLNPSSAVASSLSGPFPVASVSKPSEVAQDNNLPNTITTCIHVSTSCVATAAMAASFSKSFHSPTMASSSTMLTSSTAYSPTLASSSPPSTMAASSAANLTTMASSSTTSTSTAANLTTTVFSSTTSTSTATTLATMVFSSTMPTLTAASLTTMVSSSTMSTSTAASLTKTASSSTIPTSTAASLTTVVSSSTMSTSTAASLTTMASSSTMPTSTAASLTTMASSSTIPTSTAASLATVVSSPTMSTSTAASLTTMASSSTMPTSTAASLTTMVSSSTLSTSTLIYLATMASSPTMSTTSIAHSATIAAPAITVSAVSQTSTTPSISSYATENAVMIPFAPAISQHVLHPTVSLSMHPKDILTTDSPKAICIVPRNTGSSTEDTNNEEICQVTPGALAANGEVPGEKDTTKQMEPADEITSIGNNGHITESRPVLQTYLHEPTASAQGPDISAQREAPMEVENQKVYDDESESCKDKIDDELGHADIDDIDEPDEEEVKTTTHEEITEIRKATDKLTNSKVELDDSVKAPEEPPKEIPFNTKPLENLLVAISKINRKYSQNSTPDNRVAGAESNHTTIPNDHYKVKGTPIQENKTTVDMKNANTGDRPVKASSSSKSNDGFTLTQAKQRAGIEGLCKEAAQRSNKPKIFYKRSSQQISSNRYGKGSSRGGIKLTKKKLGNFKGPKQPHSRPPPMTQYRKPHINKISDVAKAEARENITWTQTETQSLDGQQFWSNRAPMFEPPVLTLGEGLLARYGSVDRMKRCSVVPQCRQIETLKLEHSVLPGLRVKPNMRGCYNIDNKKHGQSRAQGLDKTKTKTKSQGPKVMMQRPLTRHGGRLSRWSKYIDLSKMEDQTDPDGSKK